MFQKSLQVSSQCRVHARIYAWCQTRWARRGTWMVELAEQTMPPCPMKGEKPACFATRRNGVPASSPRKSDMKCASSMPRDDHAWRSVDTGFSSSNNIEPSNVTHTCPSPLLGISCSVLKTFIHANLLFWVSPILFWKPSHVLIFSVGYLLLSFENLTHAHILAWGSLALLLKSFAHAHLLAWVSLALLSKTFLVKSLAICSWGVYRCWEVYAWICQAFSKNLLANHLLVERVDAEKIKKFMPQICQAFSRILQCSMLGDLASSHISWSLDFPLLWDCLMSILYQCPIKEHFRCSGRIWC